MSGLHHLSFHKGYHSEYEYTLAHSCAYSCVDVHSLPTSVTTFQPETNSLSTSSGQSITYDYLIVVPGIQIKPSLIKGLPSALEDPASSVSSGYFPQYADKLREDVGKFKGGKAIFTQPGSPIKCAGAPQKVMWASLQRWREAGVLKDVDLSFITGLFLLTESVLGAENVLGMPTMFSVPKYSKILDEIRKDRGVEGLFGHDLVEVDAQRKLATFKAGEKMVQREYDLLHAVPKMGPYDFMKSSPLGKLSLIPLRPHSDAFVVGEAGYVEVDSKTTQHVRYPNIFSIGDASNLPTSKTIAAITAQAPVLVHNLHKVAHQNKPTAEYNGYTSCPLSKFAHPKTVIELTKNSCRQQ